VIEIRRYTTAQGIDVFGEWLAHLSDLKARARIAVLAGGNSGDSKSSAKAFTNCGSTGGLDTVCITGKLKWLACCCCAEEINANSLRTSRTRGLTGRTTRKDGDEMKRKPSISHDEAMANELRENPEFAVEYLRAALEEGDDPQILLIALRRIAESRGGVAKIAKDAGVERESLYRALSAKGNPRLSTLVAVTRAVGLRLTVEAAH
jgi:probable addiction module antidote protein